MKVLTLQGNHYQMGLQHGQQVLDRRPLIVAAIDARLKDLDQHSDVDGILRELEAAWLDIARSTMEMLRGIAEALTISTSRLFKYLAASYLDDLLLGRSNSEACTVWGAAGPATRDGRPILTKNRDYHLTHLPLQVLARAIPERGYRYLHVTSAGAPTVFSSGMNERGLAVADTHVASKDIGAGLARYTLMMNVLEQHATVTSALAYLREVRHMGAGNLVLADVHGNLAACESGYRRCGFIAPTNNTIVATNHFVSAELRDAYLEHPRGERQESQARYQVVQATLEEMWGELDVGKTRALMTRHENRGAAICRHSLGDESATISNVIFLPLQREILFCSGRPCQGPYATYPL